MKRITTITRTFLPAMPAVIACLLAFSGCTQEEESPETTSPTLNISVSTRSTQDPMAINNDNTFQSLAVYIFNNTDPIGGISEQFTLVPALSPNNQTTWNQSFHVSTGTKTIYVIANYAGTTLLNPDGSTLTLSSTTSRAQLNAATAQNNTGFTPASLVMVGQQAATVNTANMNASVTIPVSHLQARVDVHVFKGPNIGAGTVTLQSVTLNNQVLNSTIAYTYNPATAQMPATPLLNNQTIASTATIAPYVQGTTITPANAHALFYSFQNLVPNATPLPSSAPSITITALMNGVQHTYTGVLTDASLPAYPYCLLQNQVYQVTAVIDLKAQLSLSLSVLPWNETSINYNRPITSSDFSFGPWGTCWGGTNAKTMNTNVGGIEDAAFSFTLNAPAGAQWTATLTNGLDFSFVPSALSVLLNGAISPNTGVSKGTTRSGIPYLIAVRALKPWVGNILSTQLYITVEGQEIPINPVVGSGFKYPGTATRITIMQVASYN